MQENFYQKLVFKRLSVLLVALLLLLVIFVIDIGLGPAKYSPLEIANAIFSTNNDDSLKVILFEIRIPQALMAIAAGACLGLSGAVMQTVLANALASPYTLGIGSAASFGAALAIVLFDAAFLAISAFAFFFSTLSILAIYFLSKRIFLGGQTIVLIGIVMVFIYQSLQAFVIYLANEIEVSSIVFWTFGSLARANYLNSCTLFVALFCVLVLVMFKSWELNALMLGDEKAQSLGVQTFKIKIFMLLLVSFLTTICVCFVGTIGFVGLVGAHIARLIIGAEQRFYLLFSALTGSLILLISSSLSKSVISGVVFPIGIITSLIGAVFFLFILLNKGIK